MVASGLPGLEVGPGIRLGLLLAEKKVVVGQQTPQNRISFVVTVHPDAHGREVGVDPQSSFCTVVPGSSFALYIHTHANPSPKFLILIKPISWIILSRYKAATLFQFYLIFLVQSTSNLQKS